MTLTYSCTTWGMADPPPPLTRHVVRAALHVAAVLGEGTSPVPVARESYWRRATGGLFSPADLRLGENALVVAGFVVRDNDYLTLTAHLSELIDGDADDAVDALAAAFLGATALEDGFPSQTIDDVVLGLIDDPARREALLLALGQRFDDALRREVGAIGEELVVAHARAELQVLGHPNLAQQVRRVSLISDQIGYDVTAPRVGSTPRLLEVKATTRERTEIFLSRNEAEVALRFEDWALVVCDVADVKARTGAILGWCQGALLEPFLPADASGSRWQSVAIDIDRIALRPGLPRATG